MQTLLVQITVSLGGRPTASETSLRATAPHVLVLTTALPDLALSVVSTYVGADDVDTTVVDLVLAARPHATRAVRTVPRDALPVTHARERCLLEHLAQVHTALEAAHPGPVSIDADDRALQAAAAS